MSGTEAEVTARIRETHPRWPEDAIRTAVAAHLRAYAEDPAPETPERTITDLERAASNWVSNDSLLYCRRCWSSLPACDCICVRRGCDLPGCGFRPLATGPLPLREVLERLDPDRVEALPSKGPERPILLDGRHLIDGHHRVSAHLSTGEPIRAITCPGEAAKQLQYNRSLIAARPRCRRTSGSAAA